MAYRDPRDVYQDYHELFNTPKMKERFWIFLTESHTLESIAQSNEFDRIVSNVKPGRTRSDSIVLCCANGDDVWFLMSEKEPTQHAPGICDSFIYHVTMLDDMSDRYALAKAFFSICCDELEDRGYTILDIEYSDENNMEFRVYFALEDSSAPDFGY